MCKRFLLTCFIAGICLQVFSQHLVLPGDHPDPSVQKIGNNYWATATTSNWFPAYPLLKSKDLEHWQQQGYVFKKLPGWADYYFWAPEISYENGKVYIYYAAHKKNGNLCIAVASADKPEGPYRDHGPLMCQEVGSIDAFPMRDENGKLYLIWKEDGNSVNKPTSIWAMEMNEQRTALAGEKKELFRNTASWEGNLVEGVAMVKHNEYYYAFYAGAGCCGTGCSYGIGIARSKKLLGPWEKYDKNPLLTSDEKWNCPGHGTPVEKDGRHYFMYHAYDKNSNIFTGRQGLIMEYTLTPDGWIKFIKDTNTLYMAPSIKYYDDFVGKTLSDDWQWSVFNPISYSIKNGSLGLAARRGLTSYIGKKVEYENYEATSLIDLHSTASAGIGIIGDDKNYIAAFYQHGKIRCVQVKDGKETTAKELSIATKNHLSLRVSVSQSKNTSFSYSRDGNNFFPLNKNPFDASYLPPWDRALRVGLLAKGSGDQKAIFKRFELQNR